MFAGTQIKLFWSAAPSQAEQTHEWDVSATNWDLYPRGQYLTSPAFSCGGLDGLTMEFYPDGLSISQHGVWCIKQALKPQVVVKLQFRVESKDSPIFSKTILCDMSRLDCVIFPHFKGVVGVDKISVTVTCIKHKFQPEDVQQAGGLCQG